MPSALAAHTVDGCVIDCTSSPDCDQTRSVRSSEQVRYSPEGSTETEYTNVSLAAKTLRHEPLSSQSLTVPSLDAERKPMPLT